MNSNELVARLLTFSLAIALLSTCGIGGEPVAQTERWNLIAIVTDDQAEWAVRSYGNDEIVTPNMDRLAREGARFTNAFTASGVCTPSRVAHLTGLFPIHVGLTDVPYRDPREGLPPGVPTWPRVLQQNGYRTGLVGKWHLGRAPEHHPTNFGLDYFFGFLGGANRPQNPTLSRDGKTAAEVKGYTPDILTEDAMRFIERNQSRPFALMLHFRAPHAPHLPVPEADLKPYVGLDPTVPMVDPAVARLDDDQEPADPAAIALHRRLLKEKMVTYYASVHSVDRNLGRLLQQLDDLDLTRKTIVVFTSDHGYMFGHRGMKGKGAAQPIRNHTLDEDVFFVNMYDESFQVPLVIRWPGVVEGGRVIDELVSNVDLFPTFLGMVGVPVPAGLSLPGQDFSPILRGEDVSLRDAIFAEYTPQQIGVVEFIRMVRTKKWKLVRRYLNPGGNQLFDLENDPGEIHNLFYVDRTAWRAAVEKGLSVEHPHLEIIAKLQAKMTAWQETTKDPALQLEAVLNEAREETKRRWQ